MDEVAQALLHRYISEPASAPNVDVGEVASYLATLADFPDASTLVGHIRSNQPDWQLDDLSLAVLCSTDDCATVIFRITQIAPQIGTQFRRVLPLLAANLLHAPGLAIAKQPTLLMILDSLNQGMVGWTEGLGAGSNKLQGVFNDTIEKLLSKGIDYDAVLVDVAAFMSKESNKIHRLEERLAASETGLVRSKQAKVLAANLINKKARNRVVTESLSAFLRGPWYDSIQFLVNEKGIHSEAWQRAGALTETLLWTYQPIDSEREDAEQERQRLYRLIEHLPQEIRELLVALQHATDVAETALDTLEVDHVGIVSGMPPDYIEFEPVPCEVTESQSTVSQVLLRKVKELSSGQWFSHVEADKTQLIKLVLKLDDVNQLLFTNRNGMKVMQKSFDEFAYDLSSHVVKSINPDAVFSSTFNTYYRGLVDEFRKHRQLIADRKAEVDRLDDDRTSAQIKAQDEARQLGLAKEDAERNRQEAIKVTRLKKAREEAEKSENSDLVAEYTTIVASLGTGAMIRLPDATGEKQDCKLAVRIAAADKMIFVDQAGMKAGDYKAQQLVELLVAGAAELGDLGVEFEDTLAAIVTKLRSDREKSYDDLTRA
ncbi:MAG: hypothetical protein ACI82A_001524 [Candidatus Azotimanducaceae bacterium]|jgi:hypothetical protein